MNVLGISCFYHDAAACLYRDGQLVAAAEEERFTRRKHDASFPTRAARYCLDAGGIGVADLDYVVYYEKPFRKFARLVTTAVETFPGGLVPFVAAMRAWLGEKLWIPAVVRRELGYRGEILYCDHHLSHAASAFLPSPFEEAAVLTVDGVGEWASAALGWGRGTAVELTQEIRFPHSLGLLYSAFTGWLGFEVNEGEYKVMGLAAYGRPRYVDRLRAMLGQTADGSFALDIGCVGYLRSLHAWGAALEAAFGPPYPPGAELDERAADVAASLQLVTEEAMLALACEAHRRFPSPHLCLAGGVALNVRANRAILRGGPFRRLFVPPCAGDSGGAVGAAAYVSHAVLGQPRDQPLDSAYLGPAFAEEEIGAFLRQHAILHRRCDEAALVEAVADAIAADRVVGWFQGRMELGPRALGNRSILANPRNPAMKELINAKIKHREPFRPLAPSVTAEDAARYFEDLGESPFMLLVADVLPNQRDVIPAVTHVDGTARLQTVTAARNPLFHALLRAVERRIGVPIVLNTSFNVRGEPIVCTPADAFACFARTDLDLLALGPFLVEAGAGRPDLATPLPMLDRRHVSWVS